jgi:hypothetical protein
VIFLGPAAESARKQVIEGLQKRFKLTAQQTETLMRRAPIVVKRGLSLQKAHSLVQHLEEIGAKARIERGFAEEEPETPPPLSTAIEQEAPQGTEEISQESYCSWEDMENLGFLRAFFGTVGEALFHPTLFYSRMPVDRGLTNPLIFAILMGVLGGLIGLVYQFLMMSFFGNMFESQGFGDLSVPMMIGWAIGLPILTIVGLFLGGGILHVCLMIVRGNRRGFEATFRVIAYGMSTQIFAIIPFLGGLIGGIWALVIEIIGIRESHGTTTGKAALAIFLPLLIIVAFGVILAVIMIPIIFKAASGVIGNF